MYLLKCKSLELAKRNDTKAIAEIEHFQTYTENLKIGNQVQNNVELDLTDNEEPDDTTNDDIYSNIEANGDWEIKDKDFFNLAKFMDDDEQQKDDLAFDQLEKPNREFNETETNYQWVHKNMFDDVDEHENNGWRTKTLWKWKAACIWRELQRSLFLTNQ